MKRERHPKITPLRALELLRMLGADSAPVTEWQINQVRDALASHVKNALVARARKARR